MKRLGYILLLCGFLGLFIGCGGKGTTVVPDEEPTEEEIGGNEDVADIP